jgi:phosphoribosylformimino-5-aminoimidazole carboxamide ribotide isomerase
MLIIPAIDILDGECVRLYQGNYHNVTVYSKNPVDIARNFEEAGAVRIHIVDLGAARGDGSNNREKIAQIRETVSCTLEVGGGIRSREDIEELLSIGIDKLILGTVIVQHPDKVAEWTKMYHDTCIAGIDALDGRVKISGWKDDPGIEDTILAQHAKELGFTEIIYTNISHDGALTGPDIERTGLIAEASYLPVILSGGISCRADVVEVIKKAHPCITGIIVGKAIYEQKVSVSDLIRSFQNT